MTADPHQPVSLDHVDRLSRVKRTDQESLLLVEHVIGGFAEDESDHGCSGEDVDAREELCHGGAWDEVAVTDGGHRHNGKVDGVKYSICLFSGDLVADQEER